MATCAKRRDLSLAEKVDFLDKIHLQPPGTSHRRLAEIFGIPKSTIGRLVRNESELRKQLLEEHAQRIKASRKRKRSGKGAEVDEALNRWLRVVLARSVRINGPMLKSKAEEFARRLGSTDFVATDGWLSRWKARHDIKFKRAHGEKSSADTAGAENWISSVLPELLREYNPADIYNADETMLVQPLYWTKKGKPNKLLYRRGVLIA